MDLSMATPDDYTIHSSIFRTTWIGPTMKSLSNHPMDGPTDNGPMAVYYIMKILTSLLWKILKTVNKINCFIIFSQKFYKNNS